MDHVVKDLIEIFSGVISHSFACAGPFGIAKAPDNRCDMPFRKICRVPDFWRLALMGGGWQSKGSNATRTPQKANCWKARGWAECVHRTILPPWPPPPEYFLRLYAPPPPRPNSCFACACYTSTTWENGGSPNQFNVTMWSEHPCPSRQNSLCHCHLVLQRSSHGGRGHMSGQQEFNVSSLSQASYCIALGGITATPQGPGEPHSKTKGEQYFWYAVVCYLQKLGLQKNNSVLVNRLTPITC